MVKLTLITLALVFVLISKFHYQKIIHIITHFDFMRLPLHYYYGLVHDVQNRYMKKKHLNQEMNKNQSHRNIYLTRTDAQCILCITHHV